MNLPIVMRTLGILLLCEAAAMLLPVLVALFYGDNVVLSFLLSVLLARRRTCVFSVKVRDNTVGYREGFAIVAFGWLLASVFGALPFSFPAPFRHMLMPCLRRFRALVPRGNSDPGCRGTAQQHTVLAFFYPLAGRHGHFGTGPCHTARLGSGRAFRIMKAESPGPISQVDSQAQDTAVVVLYLFGHDCPVCSFPGCGGMPLFDSVVHAFATLGTGGFSVKNASIGAYNNTYYDVVITVL